MLEGSLDLSGRGVLADLIEDGGKKFFSGVHGPEDAVLIGLQQDKLMTWSG